MAAGSGFVVGIGGGVAPPQQRLQQMVSIRTSVVPVTPYGVMRVRPAVSAGREGAWCWAKGGRIVVWARGDGRVMRARNEEMMVWLSGDGCSGDGRGDGRVGAARGDGRVAEARGEERVVPVSLARVVAPRHVGGVMVVGGKGGRGAVSRRRATCSLRR